MLRVFSISKVFGSGSAMTIVLVASAMITGVGLLQVGRSYDRELAGGFKTVEHRGRAVTKLTDLSIHAVDLVVSALAEDLSSGDQSSEQFSSANAASASRRLSSSDLLDRRLRHLDQVSDLVVVHAGQRWQSPATPDASPAGFEAASLAWHLSHAGDRQAHIETIFAPTFRKGVAVVVSRAVRDQDGAVSGLVAAVLRPTFYETLFTDMVVGSHGAITLWRDDGRVLIRYPPIPDSVGRDLSSVPLVAAFWGQMSGSYRTHHSRLDGSDRLVAFERLEGFPSLLIATSSSVQDIVAPWWTGEIVPIAVAATCIAILISMGAIVARHRQRQAAAERIHRSDEALFRGVFDHSTDNLFVYRLEPDGTFAIEAINPAAARMAGRAPSQIVGRNAIDVLPKRIADRVFADLSATIAAADVVRFDSEFEVDGERRCNQIVQVPLVNAEGVIDRVFVGSRDVTHLKTAYARMQELNGRLVLAEQMAHVGHWRVDLPSGEVFWSDEIYRIHGLDLSLPPLGIDDAIQRYHPDDRAEMRRLVEQAMNDKRGYEFSLRLMRADGEIRHVAAQCLLELDAAGELVAIFGTFMDVTDLKHAELRLAEQSALLQTTLAHMEQGLVMFDGAGNIVVRNARAVELLGDSVGVIATPSLEYGTTGRRFDVAERTLDVRCVAVAGGGAVMTYTDVTDLQRTEKRLRQSEARYRLLAENTSELIQLGHDDGRRSYVSPAIERLLGFTVAEFSAMRLRDYVHPDDLAGLYDATRRLGSVAEVSAVYRALHKTRGWIWVEGVFRRIPDARDDEPTIVGTFRDIGDRLEQADALKRAKELAEEAQAEAERASAAKTEFLASMSHEIRTPLTGVLGYTELLLDDIDLSALQRRTVERIQNAGTALLTVVNDILDFSKIEAGQIDLELAPFQIETLLDNAVSIVRAAADRKGLSLVVTVDPTLPHYLLGDQDRLCQVLLNLLNNAVKFTPAGGIAVDVSVDAPIDHGVRARFAVTDTGIGIPVDKRQNLFERFSQVDGSIARRFGGTGLGLAISKSLITLMGGVIAVESAEGGGSTFWFSVPLSEADAPAKGSASSTPAGTPSCEGARILLVDDLEINRELGRAMLATGGHVVDVVCDGAEAIMAVQANDYDLVLMDVQMPGMDGVTATLHIRSLPGAAGRVPIIAMTANVLPDQIAQCKRAGMNDHVGKPVKRDALNAVVERYRRPIPSAGDGNAAAVLDSVVFDEIREVLGAEAMRKTLDRFADHLDREFSDILRTSREPEALSRAAHKVVSMAGSLGFMDLSKASSELEQACAADRGLDGAIAAAEEALRRALRRIVALRTP